MIFVFNFNGTPLQYSCLENPMNWRPGVLQSMGLQRVRHDWATELNWTELTDIYQKINIITVYTKRTKEKVTAQEMFTIYISYKEKAMAPHSSVLAWKIPGMQEPGWLPSIGLHRVGHDWANSLSHVAVQFSQHHSLKRLSLPRCIFLPPLWKIRYP